MFRLRIAGDGTFVPSPNREYTVRVVSIRKCLYKWMDAAKTYLPEVLDYGILLFVAAVVGVLHPVIDIDLAYTADEQLQLSLVEDVDEVSWDKLVESLDEGVELLLDTLLNAPFGDQTENVSKEAVIFRLEVDILNVFLLVLVRHLNIPSAGLEINGNLLTKHLILDT